MRAISLLGLGALLPAAFAATYDVQVGPDGRFVYTPEYVTAVAGDDVVFRFNPKNHTVTESTFASPCTRKDGAITSGFRPIAAGDPASTFTVRVNGSSPTYFYCAQGAGTANSHCGAGMVFVINPTAEGTPTSFANFKLAAQASLQSASGSATATGRYTTAAYGSVTIPAAPTPSVITATVALGTETWTSTYSSYPHSPGPTPVAAAGVVHKVIVGGPGKLVYDPPTVSAAPRDTIVFEFRQKNHTVTQSSFEDPCRRWSANGTTGFDSGFNFVADNAATFPTWNYTVKSTEPTWAYCRQTSHCGQGMVFAINSDESSERNFKAFQELAKKLNGTSLSATSASGAIQMKFGFSGLLVVLGAFFVGLTL